MKFVQKSLIMAQVRTSKLRLNAKVFQKILCRLRWWSTLNALWHRSDVKVHLCTVRINLLSTRRLNFIYRCWLVPSIRLQNSEKIIKERILKSYIICPSDQKRDRYCCLPMAFQTSRLTKLSSLWEWTREKTQGNHKQEASSAISAKPNY